MTVAEVEEQPDEINGAIEETEISQQQQQQPPAAPELPPNNTIYINNLNERVKIEELKKSLHAVFAQFGKILEILAWKSLKLKGQAWVVFDDAQSASNAMRQMQSFPFYDKPMRIRFAKKKSDIIAKADGTFVQREKKKRHEEKSKKKKEHHDGNHTTASYGYGGGHSMGGGSRSSARDGPAPPNSILFVQNLPKDSTPMMVQMFFQQYPGFKEVRMVEAKPGIAFVEYGDEIQATIAMTGLQGFKIQNSQMIITYAKK